MLTHFYVVTTTTTISAKDVFVLKGIKLGWKVVAGQLVTMQRNYIASKANRIPLRIKNYVNISEELPINSMRWGPQGNALLKGLLTHCVQLIPNIWPERKIIQSINRCLVYPLPNIWAIDGIISFLLGSLATATQTCSHSMRTKNEDDGYLDPPGSPEWDIFQVSVGQFSITLV